MNLGFVISWKKIRDFTTVKKVVYIFKERFLNNLSIRKYEYRGHPCLSSIFFTLNRDTCSSSKKFFNILLELLLFVALCNFYLTYSSFHHMCSKSGH
jgi:hypothetical protein